MSPEQIKQMIELGLPGSRARVEGDDGTHFQAVIICAAFAGKSTLQQHQLVYQALGNAMGTDIHALSMQTWTPEDWEASGQSQQPDT
ncbi:MAG: BolA/IbaG family iron-sulfur metabolism protein [Thiotrichales bacterium]|nr:BolA/IbaG family iron-sulfur metabolism protein [Thiotrichales bacterium]